MSTKIEKKAKEYLLEEFKSDKYIFEDNNIKGFDLWLKIKGKGKIKIELKATNRKFKKNNQIFSQLYFSSKKEVDYFKKGESKILRIFLGDDPPTIFLINNKILSNKVKFKVEYRAKLIGRKNYLDGTISKLK